MRIRSLYQGEVTVYDRSETAVVIGRPKIGVVVDIDLTPDDLASRPHARLFLEDGQWWIEDLGSRRGTRVDGREIKGLGKFPLSEASVIHVGATVLRLEETGTDADARAPSDSSETWRTSEDFGAPGSSDRPRTRSNITFRTAAGDTSAPSDISRALTISIVAPAADPLESSSSFQSHAVDRRGRLLYDMLLDFGSEKPLDIVLQRASRSADEFDSGRPTRCAASD